MRLEEPIDDVHAWSVAACAAIRQTFLDAKMRVAVWEPEPMPEDWT